MNQNFAFPDLGEFRIVQDILEASSELAPVAPQAAQRHWIAAGDDAAQFDGWLVTKDLSAEGTHFRLDWSSPEEAVEKHIVSNVSDISAMGGVPRFAILGICFAKSWSDEVKHRVARAFADGFRRRGIVLLGGDTVAAEKGLFSTTLLGTPSEWVLRRRAARPGDSVYVAGTLGKSAAGLWILANRFEEKERFKELVKYHLCPEIVENAGFQLVRAGVRGACMDISDGLSSELNHLALSSHVGIEIEKESLPIDKDVLQMATYFGLDPYEFALNGGEEYELLFTSSLSNSIFKALNMNIVKIGTVSVGQGVMLKYNASSVCESENKKQETILLKAGAWAHL